MNRLFLLLVFVFVFLPLSALAVGCGSSPTLVSIEPGTFIMGSDMECWVDDDNQEHCDSDDHPPHEVTITFAFKIMPREVTQGEFQNLMGYNPSFFSTCGSSCPVETVSWHEALAFANARSRREKLPECFACQDSGADVICGLKPGYLKPQDCPGYRLPTEAEWEYAARAGSHANLYPSAGNDGQFSSYNLDQIAWYWRNADRRTHAVGQKEPNAWGLYDMSGNVEEWVWDWYGPYSGTAGDPVGAVSGSFRVRRGGCWGCDDWHCRLAIRAYRPPDDPIESLGFRLARSVTVGIVIW